MPDIDLISPLSRRGVNVLAEAFRYGVRIERTGTDTFFVSGAMPSSLEWRVRAFAKDIIAVLDFWESAPVPPREERS